LRNIYDPTAMRLAGLAYQSIGRPIADRGGLDRGGRAG
jgi:hypothetical protein